VELNSMFVDLYSSCGFTVHELSIRFGFVVHSLLTLYNRSATNRREWSLAYNKTTSSF